MLLTLVSIPFVPTSISPAHRALTPVQTGAQTLFSAPCDCAALLSLLWKSAVTIPTGQEKTASPYASTPKGPVPSVTPLPAIQWGYRPPLHPRSPWSSWLELNVAVNGTHLWNSFPPCPAVVICSGPGSRGQAWDAGVGPGWR